MRILAVTPYYPPEGGGLERYAHAILRRLAARGHEVRTLAFTKTGMLSGRTDGVAVERLTPRARLGNTPLDPGFRARVAHVIKEFSPDVVVAHTPVPFPAEMASIASHRAHVPLVVTYHAGRLKGSSPALNSMAALDRWTFERQMLHHAARLIAVSPFVRDQALARHKDKTTIIPPGVDPTQFFPQGEPYHPSVLFVGPVSRSYRWKGLDVLWKAMPLVQRRIPHARLTVVGDGDRLTHFAQAAGDGVRLAGRLGERELVEEYRRASVVVLPSTTEAESFGMVLAEANACGRPVVGSSIGGIPDFLRHGDNGLLARPGDHADLAEKILRILEDPTLGAQMGERGRQRVLLEHDWEKLTDATERVLLEAARPGAAVGAVPAPAVLVE